jgi:DNA repair exonuclease SbcCD nuclease subunit
MKKLKDNPGKILFAHHAISGSATAGGMKTEFFPEVVLPKKELEKIYQLVVAGHVHHPSNLGKTIITGSIFCNEINETEKFVYRIDEDTLEVEQIKLPGRGIYKLTDPTNKDLDIPKNSIVKVILTKKLNHSETEELKEKLKVFDAHIIVSDIKNERKKVVGGDMGLLNLSVEELLELYGKERKVDVGKLKLAFELIR